MLLIHKWASQVALAGGLGCGGRGGGQYLCPGRFPGGGDGNPQPILVLLPGETPWIEEPGRLQSGVAQIRSRLKHLSTHSRIREQSGM